MGFWKKIMSYLQFFYNYDILYWKYIFVKTQLRQTMYYNEDF